MIRTRRGERSRDGGRARPAAGRSAAAALAATLALGALGGLGGCGEKIAIPHPVGLFSVSAYYEESTMDGGDPRDLIVVSGALLVVDGEGSLRKLDQNFGEITRVDGLADPVALCADDAGQVVFVFEGGAGAGDGRIDAYRSSDLSFLSATPVPDVHSAAGMACCDTGVELEPGAHTFLYVADPDSGVVHRYLYNPDDITVLRPFGILARSNGDGARFVHVPAGLARDSRGGLLVCDADTLRNWVIRFDPEPDFTDVTADTTDQDPWRGLAALFGEATCVPPSAADYTLGDAPECGATGWVGGPSDAEGAFDRPTAAAVDGSGRIFVSDSGNDRIQVFTPDGFYDMLFGSEDLTPGPTSIGVVDVVTGSQADDVNYAAYVFLLTPATQQVKKFISSEQYIYINQEPPPSD